MVSEKTLVRVFDYLLYKHPGILDKSIDQQNHNWLSHLICQQGLKYFFIYLMHEMIKRNSDIVDMLDQKNMDLRTPFEIAQNNSDSEMCLLIHHFKHKKSATPDSLKRFEPIFG